MHSLSITITIWKIKVNLKQFNTFVSWPLQNISVLNFLAVAALRLSHSANRQFPADFLPTSGQIWKGSILADGSIGSGLHAQTSVFLSVSMGDNDRVEEALKHFPWGNKTQMSVSGSTLTLPSLPQCSHALFGTFSMRSQRGSGWENKLKRGEGKEPVNKTHGELTMIDRGKQWNHNWTPTLLKGQYQGVSLTHKHTYRPYPCLTNKPAS